MFRPRLQSLFLVLNATSFATFAMLQGNLGSLALVVVSKCVTQWTLLGLTYASRFYIFQEPTTVYKWGSRKNGIKVGI